MSRAALTERAQTLGEEIANAINHGLGCLPALASLPILVQQAAQHGGAANVVAASLFSGTMILLVPDEVRVAQARIQQEDSCPRRVAQPAQNQPAQPGGGPC